MSRQVMLNLKCARLLLLFACFVACPIHSGSSAHASVANSNLGVRVGAAVGSASSDVLAERLNESISFGLIPIAIGLNSSLTKDWSVNLETELGMEILTQSLSIVAISAGLSTYLLGGPEKYLRKGNEFTVRTLNSFGLSAGVGAELSQVELTVPKKGILVEGRTLSLFVEPGLRWTLVRNVSLSGSLKWGLVSIPVSTKAVRLMKIAALLGVSLQL